MKMLFAGLVIGLCMTPSGGVSAAPRKAAAPLNVPEIVSRIGQLELSERGVDLRDVTKAIKVQPAAVATAVEQELKEQALGETQRVIYAMALGVAAQPSSVPVLIDLQKTSNPTSFLSRAVRGQLALIGGDQAGAFLLEDYRKRPPKDDEERFERLEGLAQMRYVPALKDAEAILHVNPDNLYWQVMFVFGYYDELAVPLLGEKLNGPDRIMRENALGALKFIRRPAAAPALQKRYKVESDAAIRYQLVEALEWALMSDRAALAKTFGDIVKTEKDPKTLAFAKETLAQMSDASMEAQIRAQFQPDAAKFRSAWQKLYDGGVHLSEGRAAKDLVACATKADVPALYALRRRALDRQSDECFYDYNALTRIIQMVGTYAPDKPPKR